MIITIIVVVIIIIIVIVIVLIVIIIIILNHSWPDTLDATRMSSDPGMKPDLWLY